MKKRILSGIVAMALALGGIAPLAECDVFSDFAITASAAGGIAINSTNFPDANFRKYVSEICDADGDGSLSQTEIYSVTYIGCSNRGIKSLKGIEYFTDLEYLTCSGNYLTSLDLSKNTALEILYCDNNQLTSLNVSKNTALEHLNCTNNQLTSLDVSKNTALEDLFCYYNQLTSLDVSKNTALEYLYCYYNQLKSLDLSKNTMLENLDCTYNQLTSLDVSKNTLLCTLACCYNKLTSLDISKNTYLLDAYLNPAEYHDGGSEYPDLICYLGEDYSVLLIDRSTKIFAVSTPAVKTTYTNTSSAIRINWNKVEGASGYKIFRYNASTKKYELAGKVNNNTTFNYLDSNLKDGTKYQYQVQAFVNDGKNHYYYSDMSKTITAWTKPATPTVKTTYTNTSTAIRINWNKVTGASGYKIFRYNDKTKAYELIGKVNNNTTFNYLDSKCSAGTTYKYQVQAFTNKGDNTYLYSGMSSTITAATKPAATKITKNTQAKTAVRLYWNKVNCTGYKIQQYKNGSWETIKKVAMGTTEYRVEGLKANTSYKFRIQPYYTVGSVVNYGAVSETYTAKTTK